MTSKVNSMSPYLARSRFLCESSLPGLHQQDINKWRILVKQQPDHLQSAEFAYTYWLEENLLLGT